MLFKRSTYFFVCHFILSGSALPAQTVRAVTHQQLIWFNATESVELNTKCNIGLDLSSRYFIGPFKLHQNVARIRVHYNLNSQWNVSGGFTLLIQEPHDPYSTSTLSVPELRPHLEAAYQGQVGKLTLTHRYRAEQRFIHNTSGEQLTAGYSNTYRFRYRLGFEYILFTSKKKQSLKLKVSDELLLNAGKNVQQNIFDNNRLYMALNYASGNFGAELGYTYWIQQTKNGTFFYYRNIFSLTLFHKLSFAKKDK